MTETTDQDGGLPDDVSVAMVLFTMFVGIVLAIGCALFYGLTYVRKAVVENQREGWD